jgi:hypothetical protein
MSQIHHPPTPITTMVVVGTRHAVSLRVPACCSQAILMAMTTEL